MNWRGVEEAGVGQLLRPSAEFQSCPLTATVATATAILMFFTVTMK